MFKNKNEKKKYIKMSQNYITIIKNSILDIKKNLKNVYYNTSYKHENIIETKEIFETQIGCENSLKDIFNGLDLELNKEKQINISYIESELKIKKDQKIFNYKKNIDNTRININRKKNHNYLKRSCNEKKII